MTNLPARPASTEVEILSRRRVYDGFCKVDVIEAAYTRLDGSPGKLSRELHHHGNAVAVLPVDRNRKTVLLVRQLRIPPLVEHDNGFPLEVCAGLIDPGENAAEAAAREMQEELGFRPRGLQAVCSILPSPGMLGEKLDLFLADYEHADNSDFGGGFGGGVAEEGEDIEILEFSCRDLAELLRKGDLQDAKTVVLVQRLMLDEPELFA